MNNTCARANLFLEQRRDYYTKSKLFKIIKTIADGESCFLQYIYCPQAYVNELICLQDVQNLKDGLGRQISLSWEEVIPSKGSKPCFDYFEEGNKN